MRLRLILTNSLQGFRCARGTLVLAFAILALALTASTVTFSIVDAVAFRPLPYTSPEDLVGITSSGSRPGAVIPVLLRDFFTLDGSAQALDVAASRPAPPMRLGDPTSGELLSTRSATIDLFSLLGVTPFAGRLFEAGDDSPSGVKLAVLTHEFWTSRLNADRGVIGTTRMFGLEPVSIIGVLPPGVWYPMEFGPPALYVAYVPTDADRGNTRLRALSVVGRLRPGTAIEQARADIDRLVSVPVTVQPLQDQVVGSARRWLQLLFAAVLLILAIACVNAATLLLARAATRANEFAIRASLGEERRTVAAGLLVESLAIALAAGATAIALSLWGVEAAAALIPPGLLTRTSTIAVNSRVLAAAIGLSTCCAIIFGTAPAWLAARANPMAVIKASGGPIIGGLRIERSLTVLLVSQVTVVCVLVVAATLVVRSFITISTADLGFDRHNIATIEFMRSPATFNNDARLTEAAVLRSALLTKAKSVPGVIDAAISMNASVPLSGAHVYYSLDIPGFGEASGDDMPETRIVTPEYFSVMGMRLVRGRLLNADDRAGAPPVMLINDIAAQRFFPGRDPVGQVVRFRGPTTIVGVLKSVRFDGPEGELKSEMYLPAEQERLAAPRDMGAIVIRTSGGTPQIAAAVREAIRPVLGAEPGAPQLVNDFFRRLTAGRRLNASIMGVLGGIAIALSVFGVYGTMQFLVTRQFRDIGLRLALGATPARIMRSVLSVALRRVTMGLVLGLVSAWAISSTFQSWVFGVTPTDPGTYSQVAAFIALIGLAAAFVPALRAARLDPVETLRRE